MVAPQTGIESNGDWLTLDDEITFLNQIAADHPDVVISEHGTTAVYDYTLRRVVLDRAPDGAPTVLFVGGVHGNEPAGREIVLKALRDFAYSTDPVIVSVLSKVRFVFLPTVNPTGRFRNNRAAYISLSPTEVIDPNREYLVGHLAETRMVQQTITDFSPSVVIDWHEYLSPQADRVTAETLPTTNPNVHPGIKTLIDNLESAIWAGWAGEGIPYKRYGALSPDPQTGWNNGALRHAVTITPETPAHPNAAVPPAERMRMMQSVLDTVVDWVSEKLPLIVAASSESRATAVRRGVTGRPKFILPNNQILSPAPYGYENLSSWPAMLNILGIVGDEEFVSLAQDDSALAMYMLDPETDSPMATVSRAERPVTAEPMPDGVLTGMVVQVNGSPKKLLGVWSQIDGRRAAAIPART